MQRRCTRNGLEVASKGMSGLDDACNQPMRVRRTNERPNFGWPRTRTKYGYDDASNLTSITPNGPQVSYSYTAANAIIAGHYDANGSPTSLGANAYTWDGANRISSFANSAAHTSSTFTYDGLGRIVRITDSESGTVIADHSYFWCGTVRCLAHDNTKSGSPVSTEYFAQGAVLSGTPYYYVRDELGSVTELVTASGNVAAEYAYDAYGNRSLVSGSLVSDIGYAGYFYHANSGLELTENRAYDPVHSRWLNRDPIAEAGGLNLYAYVDGNPISRTDPKGEWGLAGAGIAIAVDLGRQLFIKHRSLRCVNVPEVVVAGIIGLTLPSFTNVADAALGFEQFLPVAYQGVGSSVVGFGYAAGVATNTFLRHIERT